MAIFDLLRVATTSEINGALKSFGPSLSQNLPARYRIEVPSRNAFYQTNNEPLHNLAVVWCSGPRQNVSDIAVTPEWVNTVTTMLEAVTDAKREHRLTLPHMIFVPDVYREAFDRGILRTFASECAVRFSLAKRPLPFTKERLLLVVQDGSWEDLIRFLSEFSIRLVRATADAGACDWALTNRKQCFHRGSYVNTNFEVFLPHGRFGQTATGYRAMESYHPTPLDPVPESGGSSNGDTGNESNADETNETNEQDQRERWRLAGARPKSNQAVDNTAAVVVDRASAETEPAVSGVETPRTNSAEMTGGGAAGTDVPTVNTEPAASASAVTEASGDKERVRPVGIVKGYQIELSDNLRDLRISQRLSQITDASDNLTALISVTDASNVAQLSHFATELNYGLLDLEFNFFTTLSTQPLYKFKKGEFIDGIILSSGLDFYVMAFLYTDEDTDNVDAFYKSLTADQLKKLDVAPSFLLFNKGVMCVIYKNGKWRRAVYVQRISATVVECRVFDQLGDFERVKLCNIRCLTAAAPPVLAVICRDYLGSNISPDLHQQLAVMRLFLKVMTVNEDGSYLVEIFASPREHEGAEIDVSKELGEYGCVLLSVK